MLNIDIEKLEKSVAEQVSDYLIYKETILKSIRDAIDEKINNLFADKAESIIADRVNAAINDGFERTYQRVDQYGRAIGSPTTIAKELEKLIGDYWSQRVDRQGKPTSDNYNTTSRAEYIMAKVCADDFSEQMKSAALNVTGALKDGLRNQLAKHMDQMLDGLFHIKSLQDQGKVAKPY